MARTHGVVKPAFWTGKTGRNLRGKRDAQLLAAYLITGPHVTMCGFYYLPLSYVTHDLGMAEPDLRDALSVLDADGFAHYDEDEELVWVPNLARDQVGIEMKAGDKKRAPLMRLLMPHRKHRFFRAFVTKYGQDYLLDTKGLLGEEKGASVGAYAPVPTPTPIPTPTPTQDPDPPRLAAPPPVDSKSGSQAWFSNDTIAEMFSSASVAAGRPKWTQKMSDYRRLEDCVKVLKDLTDRDVVGPASARAYFDHADTSLKRKGFPFWGWANELEHWIHLARNPQSALGQTDITRGPAVARADTDYEAEAGDVAP